jgi:hypothetical protein
MNKYIDDLACSVIDTLPDGDWYVPDEFIEQFAQLVIEECAKILEDLKDHSVPASEYADQLRKHFGVVR